MAILTVGPNSSFATIADAISVSIANDVIQLEAGYGNENALVTVDGLSFDGELSSTGVSLQLDFGVGTVTLLGSAPINILDNAANNTIIGNDGDNTITVSSGTDNVSAGNGSDRLIIDYSSATGAITGTPVGITDGATHAVTFTGVENFTLTTGSGADTITVLDGDNFIYSGGAADTITAGNGANTLDGESGNDTITGGSGVNTINGGTGNDIIVAGDGGNTVDSGDGDDSITMGAGDDIIVTGLGNDTVTAGGGADVTTVNAGLDNIDNGTGNDRLIVDYSGMTTDVTGGVSGGSLVGGYDGNFAVAGGGNSVSFFGTENFTVTTGSGNDTISTGDGDDVLDGGAGFDQLNGGGGNDVFIAGAADDTMNGDSGTDSVIFSGARSDYQVFQTGGSTVLIIDMRNGSPDGSDSLQNFESFVFTDGTFDATTVLIGAPSTGVMSLAFSADTGASNTDFITNTAAQDISGVLDANLASGETVEVSLDNGATWTTATSSVGTDTFVLSGQTLAGSNVLMARVTNLAGDGTAASQAYVLDSSAPGQPAAATLSAASDSGTLGDDITSDTTPEITGTAEAGSTVTLYDTDGTTVLGSGLADGSGNYSITSTILTAGAHTLTVKAVDTAGNVGVVSPGLTLAIDTSAPGQPSAPTLSAGSDTGTPGDNITSDTTPTVTGTAEAGSTVTLYDTNGTTVLGSGLADGSGNYSITSTILTAGAHTLTVKATDTAGNVGVASSGLAVTIDTSAPGQPAAPTLLAASDSGTSGDNITSDTTPTVTGTAEAGSTVTLYDTNGTTVLGSGLADGSGNYSITSTILTAGTHMLTVKAGDTAGNVGVASSGLALTIDTSAPGQPAAPTLLAASDSGTSGDDITKDTTPTVIGTAEAGSTVTLYDTDGTTVLGSAVASDGTWSITTLALGEGSHSISATATDAAGNQSVPSSDLTITIDTTPPGAPGIALAFDSGVSNADHVTNNSQVSYVPSEDGGSLLFKADDAASFSFGAPAFTTQGLHTVLVEQQDAAGNIGAAASLSFTFDSIAPHLNGITANPQSGNNTSGSTVHFTLAFDEAVNVTGGTPTLTLNDGASAVYNAEATAALHDATRLAFDYLVSSSDAATPSLAITGFVSHGAAIDDLAGNHADVGNVAAAAFAALSVNEAVGTVIPAFTINGFTRPELHLDTTGHIILDEVATHAAEMYGLRFLYLGVPASTPYPPVADMHLADGHLT